MRGQAFRNGKAVQGEDHKKLSGAMAASSDVHPGC